MKYQHKIFSDTLNNIPTIFIEGDLTSDADPDTKAIFKEIKEKSDVDILMINFEKTQYINSSGIATLITIIQDINTKNGTVAFVGLSDHLHKVMEIVGISDFVSIYKTQEEALKDLEK